MQKEDELLRKEDERFAELDARLDASVFSSFTNSNRQLHTRQVRDVIALVDDYGDSE